MGKEFEGRSRQGLILHCLIDSFVISLEFEMLIAPIVVSLGEATFFSVYPQCP